VLARKAVDGGAEALVGNERVAVLRDDQKARPPRLHVLRDALDELDHRLGAADLLEDVDAVEIDAVEAGIDDAVGVVEDDRLPLRVPDPPRVFAAPALVPRPEPLARAVLRVLRPVPAIVFRLADAHVGEHDAPRAVALAAHRLDLRAAEVPV